MKTVGIIYKKEDSIIAGTAKQITKELKKAGYRVDLNKADFVITLGGDGTILRASRMLAEKKLPILGIHMGGLGFLTEIDLEQLTNALQRIKKKKYKIDERTMIEAGIGGKKLLALNDIVISKSGIARVIRLEVEGITEYLADGLIFATATGSTAYNLSAGGPLLDPHSPTIVLSAICPHKISIRPIVLEKGVTVKLTRGDKVIVTADGQNMLPLKVGQKVKIEKSKLKTRFIRLDGYDFFGRVKQAFGFGVRV